jgi:hypothetical protein
MCGDTDLSGAGCGNSASPVLTGHIKKFNPKTVKLLTANGAGWNVGYEWLFKIFEGQKDQGINGGLPIEGTAEAVK